MDYDQTIAHLCSLESTLGWDLKLERVRAALAALGSPERAYPSLLIAGTNGKGATAAIVHSALGAAGLRSGLYTSPHLVHFTERIRVGSTEIARERVVEGVARIRDRMDAMGIRLTFFEMTTVLAFVAFAEAGVDVAVLEVGLGGRLDATNVVEPDASAVVSIGYDHEDFLGPTLTEIAREKAGVMRPGRVTVLGPGLPEEARVALLEAGERVGAVIREVPAVAESAPEFGALPLAGAHMRANAAVADALLTAAGEARAELRSGPRARAAGFAAVRWPARLEVVQRFPTVVVDGAHNREGATALARALPPLVGGRRVRLLFSALADKHWRDLARVLAPLARSVVVTAVGGPRGAAPADLASAFPPGMPIVVEEDPARAFRSLISSDRDTPILVAGSLFLAGAVYAEILDRHGLNSVFESLPETTT